MGELTSIRDIVAGMKEGGGMLLNEDKLRQRIYAVYYAMRTKAKPRYFKSGKRMGVVSRPGLDSLPFTKEQLFDLAMQQVGPGAILCPYCVAIGRNAFPITLENCVFDHKEPLAVLGPAAWTLANLFCICEDCNKIKGSLSYDLFIALMQEIEKLTGHDRTYLLRCLRTHGIAQQAQRGKWKGRGEPKPAPPMVAAADDF